MIIDIELFNKLSYGSNKRVRCKCDKCGIEQFPTKRDILKRGLDNYPLCKPCAIRNHHIKCKEGDKLRDCIILKIVSPNKHGKSRALFLCICGNEFEANVRDIKNGNTKSCGCYSKRMNTRAKHGHSNGCSKKKATKEYTTFLSMRRRCNNPTDSSYPRYGGRGIKICERWTGTKKGEGFINFLADMGLRPEGSYSIDRIDVNGNYEPGNCRWATLEQQARNRRDTILIVDNNVTKTLRDYADEYKLDYKTLYNNIRKSSWENKKKELMTGNYSI